jgi:hypothetical protein
MEPNHGRASLDTSRSFLLNDIPAYTSWAPASSHLGPPPSDEYWLYQILSWSQYLSVDILPVTRQSVLDSLGSGATTCVTQGLVSTELHLAFKPVRSLEIFLRELTLLAYNPIRMHPFISQIYGISWDFATFETTCPVLVFEKAPLANLKTFMQTEHGRKLDVFQRIIFAFQIAVTLRDLEKMSKPCFALQVL